jgi:hypothetical protein
MARPTETSIVTAAAAVINTALSFTIPSAKVVPRWILGLSIGEALSHLAPVDLQDNLLPTNAWVLTINSWIPSKVRAAGSLQTTPKNFVPGFDDWQPAAGGGDRARQIDYKVALIGSLKIWQLVGYNQGNDTANSENQSMADRQLVIDEFTRQPRLGLNWPDLEHDELKFPSISVVPFGTTLLHVAQGNVPFNFTYVVKPT